METTPLTAILPPAAAAGRPPTLAEAASDFAAVFYQTLMKHAWKPGGYLSGGREAQAFYDQLSWEYGRLLARSDAGGLAGMIAKSLARTARAEGEK